jgi:hypothetical protein
MVRDASKVVTMADSRTDERGALFVTADSEDPRFSTPFARSLNLDPVRVVVNE